MVDFLSVEKRIGNFISEKLKEAGAKGVVLGLSGGVDSAVVAALSARALDKDCVLALIMPSPTNSPHDVEDAKSLADSLGIRKKIIPLKGILGAFSEQLPNDEKAMGNLTARIRMSILYYYANIKNYLVLGTSNKTELSVGYFTKYGDGASDALPIGDLYKTEVWGLARHLDIPRKITNKSPSAGLWPGQTDEDEMGVTYDELDKVLSGRKGIYFRIKRMVNASEHKRNPPEVCKL
jgi:NAD+ synthase